MINPSSGAAIALMIGAIVLTATAGDVLLASAMRAVGDLDQVKAERGLRGAIWKVVSEGRFLAGGACMALSFFSLLFSLSHADVSLIAPAAGSLTFVSNAVAAKWVLHENVDRRVPHVRLSVRGPKMTGAAHRSLSLYRLQIHIRRPESIFDRSTRDMTQTTQPVEIFRVGLHQSIWERRRCLTKFDTLNQVRR
jgi:hypothetical protein